MTLRVTVIFVVAALLVLADGGFLLSLQNALYSPNWQAIAIQKFLCLTDWPVARNSSE